MKRLALALILLSLVVSGCAQKAATKTDDQAQKSSDADAAKKDAADKVTDRQVPSKIESVDSKDGSAQKLSEQEGIFKDVQFDYDKYEVKESYQPAMKSIASWMTKNAAARLSVEGHCDERGTNEYNLALGDRRAKAVRDTLVALGVPSSKIDIISYGEEKPLCKEQTEECWSKNRRAHFVVLTKAGK
jgi:peptidoglycan-associated lipoprotein